LEGLDYWKVVSGGYASNVSILLLVWTITICLVAVKNVVLEKAESEAAPAGITPVVIDPTNKIEIIIINPRIALIFFIGFNKRLNLLLALS